ncbi:Bidirectional sugar transporter SWEET4, partial [Linum perenne]
YFFASFSCFFALISLTEFHCSSWLSAGNVISLCLFLSPVPTFVKICKKGSVEQYKPDPYLATLLNCMAWVVYGLPIIHPNSTLVLTINGAGTFIQFVYIALYLRYSNKKKRKLVIKTRSVEYMPFTLSLASFANGACWTAYALIQIDWFILIPNGLGALLAVGQLVLYATFYKSTKKQIAERKETEKVGDITLSQVVLALDEEVVAKSVINGVTHISV